jgi:hypothetical protein
VNTDVEELLRDGIDRLTAGATVPGGLAERARRRHRRRRAAIRAGALAATAVTAAAVVIGVTAAPHDVAPAGGSGQVRTAAYVISRTAAALTAAEGANAIQEIHTVGRGAWLTLMVSDGHRTSTLSAPRAVIWLYRGKSRQQGFTAAGSPLFDVSSNTVTSYSGHVAATQGVGVDYPARSWWRTLVQLPVFIVPASPAPRCDPAVLPPVGAPGNWAAAIRRALACGTYRVTGHQRIDGVSTIKIVSVWRAGPATWGPLASTSQTLWVDPSTYLPVQLQWTWPQGPGKPHGSLAASFQWLAPIKANLAALHAAIPPGFHQLAIPSMLQPTFSSTAPNQ